MPAVVDHEHRRNHVARIAAGIIARIGIDAVTMRQVAAEAGFSTAIVTHYFASKQDLLLHTYRTAAEDAQRRLALAQARDPRDLLGCLEALLPRDEASRHGWRVFLAFWHTAVLDPLFAEEQASQALQARALLRGVLEARARTGLAPAHEDLDGLAQHLLVIVIGVAVQAVFDPVTWSPEVIRKYLVTRLGEWCMQERTH